MSKRTDRDFLIDMDQAIHRISEYTAGMSFDSFMHDTKTQDAVIRNLEIIGEAAKHISSELRAKHPDVPWKNMGRVRDRLIHHYFGVNLDIVWQIVVEELAPVAARLESIQREENA